MDLIEVIRDASSVCVVLVSLGGGVAIIAKVLNFYSSQKEFRKTCEGYKAEIDEVNNKVTKAHNCASEAIEQMQAETDAKLQEIRAEQEMITYCMRAVLDGLHQLNCNGPVTEASEKLDKYLNYQAHK